jgi:hypothetical protein
MTRGSSASPAAATPSITSMAPPRIVKGALARIHDRVIAVLLNVNEVNMIVAASVDDVNM